MTIKNITIFDLDGTIIDSSHRQATLADGTLNLPKWIENSTPEKIFGDTVLPLATQVRRRQKAGDYVMVCTARNMQDADFEFLQNEGICPDKIISRPKGNMEADGVLKAKQLNSFLSLKQFQKASKIMFDDAATVRSSLRKIGIAVINPEKIAVEAVDSGPGIFDIKKAMEPGYSTAPDFIRELGFGAGMGLCNIKKCSDDMRLESTIEKGTRLNFFIYLNGESESFDSKDRAQSRDHQCLCE